MQNLEDLIYDYYEIESKELLEEVYKQSTNIMKSWTFRYTKIPRGEATTDFVSDVCLSFIGKVIRKTILDNHITVLLNIGRMRFKHEFIDPSEIENLRSVDPEDTVEITNLLEHILITIPERLKYVFLYTLLYGKDSSVLEKVVESDLSKILIKYQVQEVFRIMGNTKDIEVSIPSTNASKVLLLAALYNKQPALLVLFLLFKDLSKFLQFCSLFSGNTVVFPEISELTDLFKQVSKTGEALSSGNLKEEDSKFLEKFALDLRSKSEVVSVNPVLDEYCRDSIGSLVENYDSLHKRMLNSISGRDTKHLSEAFKLLNTELQAQFRLFSEVLSVANIDKKS